MTSGVSGFRFASKQQSGIKTNILDDEETLRSVCTLRQVFQSCLGPSGRCKFIHNGVGGHVTVTSSASRLLRTSQVTHPALRLVTTAVQSHLELHRDGGTMAATLALLVIERALKLTMSRRLITDILDAVTGECIRFLDSDECPARVSISLDSLCDLLSVVNGITSTKPACGMTLKDVEHINRCIVKAFLETVPHADGTKSTYGDVQYLCVEGQRTVLSNVVSGMYVGSPHIPTCKTAALNLKHVPDGSKQGLISIVVYGISLAGDAGDNLDAEFEVAQNLSLNGVVLDKMLDTANDLIRRGVGVVACQKVIHPQVKRCLVDGGIMVMDRLGIAQVKLLCKTVGGPLLGSFLAAVEIPNFGYIRKIAHEVIGGRSYLRVEGASTPVWTLVLYALTEEALDELKQVCCTANHVLRHTVQSQVALKGGGEWQRQVASHVKKLVDRAQDLSKTIGCSKSAAASVIECISDCFQGIYCTVSEKNCLEFSKGETLEPASAPVLDSFQPAMSALKTALFSAHLVLGIKHYITDVN